MISPPTTLRIKWAASPRLKKTMKTVIRFGKKGGSTLKALRYKEMHRCLLSFCNYFGLPFVYIFVKPF